MTQSTHPGAGIRWIDADGTEHLENASPHLLDRELYLASTVRRPKSYVQQRNYHGYYFMAATGRHAWFESLLEESRLAMLDMRGDVVALATQPMQMLFRDGSHAYPDFLALHGDRTQTVFEVKPSRKVDAHLEKFAKTKAICDLVGWGFQVLPELTPSIQRNVDYLRQFKHFKWRPAQARVDLLMADLDLPMTFVEAAYRLRPDSLPHGRSGVLHLIWSGELSVELSEILSDSSPIERANDENR